MSKFNSRAGFAAILLATAACTQPPAPIALKGQNTYGRNDASYAVNNVPATPLYSYTGSASASASNTSQSASIQHVGVTELSALAPAAGGDVQTKPVVLSSASPTPLPVNPWTGKPHFTSAENTPNTQSQPVAQLDSIIGNDGSKPRPAKVETVAFMWPVDGTHIISGFGPKGSGKINDGINIAASEGEPVWAAADGEIVYVGNELQGYGNMVLIKHTGGKTTAYAHLSRAIVDKYDRVRQGDIIGYVGSTGNVKEPQLHFAIRDGNEPVDPAKYLNRRVASN